MKNQMTPYVFITDDGYVIPTIVAIQSLALNYDSRLSLEVVVICTSISDENRTLLGQLNGEKCCLTILDFNTEAYKKYSKEELYVTPTSLVKFEIANILDRYGKAVYLDGDIIVSKDISKILDIDIENYYCAAVQDFESCEECISPKRLNLPFYINSGVMYLNLEKMRRDRLSSLMFKIKETRQDLYYMDQDVINLAFDGNVFLLDVKFNYIINTFLTGKYDLSYVNRFFCKNHISFDQYKEEALILHLAGSKKPWKTTAGLCYNEWITYFNESPLKEVELNIKDIKTSVSKNHSLFDRIITKKKFVNKNNEYTIGAYIFSIPLITKIRKANGVVYRLFDCITIKKK